MAEPNALRTIASLMRPAKGFTLSDADMVDAAADEIDRLRKMLTDHGIDPDGEYIAPGGLRVDAPASKNPVKF